MHEPFMQNQKEYFLIFTKKRQTKKQHCDVKNGNAPKLFGRKLVSETKNFFFSRLFYTRIFYAIF